MRYHNTYLIVCQHFFVIFSFFLLLFSGLMLLLPVSSWTLTYRTTAIPSPLAACPPFSLDHERIPYKVSSRSPLIRKLYLFSIKGSFSFLQAFSNCCRCYCCTGHCGCFCFLYIKLGDDSQCIFQYLLCI